MKRIIFLLFLGSPITWAANTDPNYFNLNAPRVRAVPPNEIRPGNLAYVTVVPSELNVIWGYAFSADVTVGEPVNLGNSSQPIAAFNF